jgi:hypothetical protein
MVIRTRKDPKMSNTTYGLYDVGMACFRLLKVLTSAAPITITAILSIYKKKRSTRSQIWIVCILPKREY